MSIAFNNIRINTSYQLTNYGEQFNFTVMDILSGDDFRLKDLFTMEEYLMSDLIGSGKGKDFSVWEVRG